MTVGELKALLTLDKTGFDVGLATAGAGVSKFGGAAGKVISAFAKVAIASFAAISVAIGKAIHDAEKFEKQMAFVSTMLVSRDMKYMARYHDEVLKMSAAFGESTETLTKSLYDILSASIPPADAMKVLQASAVTAAAGMTDTATATQVLVAAMNAYGIAAKDVNYIADIMWTTVKRGIVTFPELAETMGMLTPIASIAGVSLKELGATLAIITRNGINSHHATVALKQVMMTYLKPTEEATRVSKELGIEFSATALRTKGLKVVLDEIKKLPPEVIAKLFPNVRALLGAASALGQVKDELVIFDDIMKEGSPNVEAFNKATGTTAFTMAQFRETMRTLSIQIGEKFLVVFGKLIQQLSAWVQGKGGEAILAFFQNVAIGVENTVNFLADFGAKAKVVFGWLREVLGPVYNAWKQTIGMIASTLWEAVEALFGFEGDADKTFSAVQDILKGFAATLMVTYKILAFVFSTGIDLIKNFMQALYYAGESIALVFQGRFKEANQAAGKFWQNIKEIGTETVENWTKTVATVPAEINKMFGATNISVDKLRQSTEKLTGATNEYLQDSLTGLYYERKAVQDNQDAVETAAERRRQDLKETEDQYQGVLREQTDETKTFVTTLATFWMNDLEKRRWTLEQEVAAMRDAKLEEEKIAAYYEYETSKIVEEEVAKRRENLREYGDYGLSLGQQSLDDWRRLNSEATQDTETMLDKIKNYWKAHGKAVGAVIQAMWNQLKSLVNMYFQNQLGWIDYNLEREKKALFEKYGDTAEYQKKVEELEKEAAKKKYDIQLKAFKAEQAASIVDVVIQTAIAIMKAFADLGPIGGAIAAAMLTGLSIAQIALIASQPPPAPPFRKGGLVEAAEGGQLIGGPGVDTNLIRATTGEYIMPPAQTAANINELEAMRAGERPAANVTIESGVVSVLINGREIAQAAIPFLTKASDEGQFRVAPRAVRAS